MIYWVLVLARTFEKSTQTSPPMALCPLKGSLKSNSPNPEHKKLRAQVLRGTVLQNPSMLAHQATMARSSDLEFFWTVLGGRQGVFFHGGISRIIMFAFPTSALAGLLVTTREPPGNPLPGYACRPGCRRLAGHDLGGAVWTAHSDQASVTAQLAATQVVAGEYPTRRDLKIISNFCYV